MISADFSYGLISCKGSRVRKVRVEFIGDNGGGPGVRLRKSAKEKPGK